MKKLICITGIILMVCLFTGAYFAPADTTQAQTLNYSDTKSVQKDLFVLKAENNRIVVYKNGGDLPYLTTDTLVNTLPKGDIMLLEKGIEIKGEENLRKSLEDYCS